MPSRLLQDLYETTRQKAEHLLVEATSVGLRVKVTSTVRTFAEQAALYSQGRTTPGKIVTRSKPGDSMHNVRRAFDVAILDRDGDLSWEFMDSAECAPLWVALGAIGKRCGLEWGGAWTTMKDRPHFEDSYCENCEIDVRHLAGPTARHFDESGACKDSLD